MHLCLMPRCWFASIVDMRFCCANRVPLKIIKTVHRVTNSREIAHFLRHLDAIDSNSNSMKHFQRCGCSIFQRQANRLIKRRWKRSLQQAMTLVALNGAHASSIRMYIRWQPTPLILRFICSDAQQFSWKRVSSFSFSFFFDSPWM